MTFRRFLLFLLLVLIASIGAMYWTATWDPVVRAAEMRMPRWPAGAPPVRAVLISDIHVAGPDMPPERLARIVGQINALRPDIVLIAGDFISDRRFATRHYAYRDAVAPLAALRSQLGTFAVLGNHDHWRDAGQAREALQAVGVHILANEAVRAGPLAIGGLDDAFTDHDDLPRTISQLRRLRGARLILSHSPDRFPDLPGDIPLMLAGHTHCGQIRLPFFGAVASESRYGQRYICGWVGEHGHDLIVSAGLGTSIVPLRLGARPDLWLITLGPEQRRRAGR